MLKIKTIKFYKMRGKKQIMEQLNNKKQKTLEELNELATKNLKLIEELEKVNEISEEYKNDFSNKINKIIQEFTKKSINEELEENEENEENKTTKNVSDNQLTQEKLKELEALYNMQSKEIKKDFNEFTKSQIKFDLNVIDNNYNLKIYTNKEIVEELKRFCKVEIFNEKLEKEKLSNNQIKRCFNYALHLSLKKHYEEILNDKENNKKEKSLNNYKINNAKLFNDFNEKVLFEYYVISEENNKKELKRIGTK